MEQPGFQPTGGNDAPSIDAFTEIIREIERALSKQMEELGLGLLTKVDQAPNGGGSGGRGDNQR